MPRIPLCILIRYRNGIVTCLFVFPFFLSLSLSEFNATSHEKRGRRKRNDIKRPVITCINSWNNGIFNFTTSVACNPRKVFLDEICRALQRYRSSRVNNCKNIYFLQDIWFYRRDREDWIFFFFFNIFPFIDPIRSDEIRTIMEPRTCGPLDHPYVGRTKKERGAGRGTEPYVQRSR